MRLPAACVSGLLALVLGISLAGSALGDDKEVCVSAVEHAQVVRLDGKLREAREGFVTCARAVCPDAIRRDCTRWVTEVDASLPSVVFDAVWADGRDVTGMTVLLDGKPLAGAEQGRAVTLDPGEHTFRFEVAGAVPVETRNVIREGEKNRILHATFVPAAPAEPTVAAGPAPAPPSVPAPSDLWHPVPTEEGGGHSTRRRPIPLAAFIFGGVGLAGLGGFAYLGLDGTSRLDSMRSTCVHACSPAAVTSARNEILVGDILGYIGLAAAGVAGWLVLTRPDVPVDAALR